MIEQGYNVLMPNTEGIIAPASTPPAIIQYLETAIKGVTTDPVYIAQMQKLGIDVKFRGSKESEEWMTQLENTVRPLILEERKKQQ
jgi:tripartite-type tricarboxylate transporter receptor subunit TctC